MTNTQHTELRRELAAHFSLNELTMLAYDTPPFRAMYDRLETPLTGDSPHAAKARLIEALIAAATATNQTGLLWGWIRVEQQRGGKQPTARFTRHHFISYSLLDGEEAAIQVAQGLQQLEQPCWFDLWHFDEYAPQTEAEQIRDALHSCTALLLLITPHSVRPHAESTSQWQLALSYKKPLIPIITPQAAEIELPFRLQNRRAFRLAELRGPAQWQALQSHIRWLISEPAGQRQHLRNQLADAEHDLRAARRDRVKRQRIRQDVQKLTADLARLERRLQNPEAAARRTEESIARGMERERQPDTPPPSGRTATRQWIINLPPAPVPDHFQNRHAETKLVGQFIKHPTDRLLVVVGRGGIGKTALVSRVLQTLERGELPDEGGPLKVRGIIYLSERGMRPITLTNLMTDLCALLPPEQGERLMTTFQHRPLAESMAALTAAFRPPGGGFQALQQSEPVLLLLDNFEDLLTEAGQITEPSLEEALRLLLSLPPHPLKLVLTSRSKPQALLHHQPQNQAAPMELAAGLNAHYTAKMLQAMDPQGALGLQTATPEQMKRAYTLTRGYPRAVEALKAILAADRDIELPTLLQQQTPPEQVVEVLVAEAYNRLAEPAQQVLQALAIYNRPVKPTAVDYLLQPYQADIDSAPLLGRLVNMQFVRKEAGRYSLHPVDRAYALSRITLQGEAAPPPTGGLASPPTTESPPRRPW